MSEITINTNSPHNKTDPSVSTHCLTIQCLTCEKTQKISGVAKPGTITVPNCALCGRYEAQSEEYFVADQSFFDIFARYNPLNETSTNDIINRKNVILEWLYEGSQYGKSFISHYTKIPIAIDHHINLIEDVIILMHAMLRSRSFIDRHISIVAFCKMRGSRPGLSSMLMYALGDIFGKTLKDNLDAHREMDKIYADIKEHVISELDKEETPDSSGYELQDAEYDNIFAEMRTYTQMYDRIKETTLYKKVYRFGLYVLTSGLLNNTNLTFESLGYSRYEQAAIERTHKPGIDMVHCMIDTILFVCDRGAQYFKTQDPDVLMSSGGNHDKWMSRAQRLIRESKFLNNPEPHGIRRCTFTAEIKDTIERGIALIKYSAGLERTEKMYLQKILNELQLIQANELTKKDARTPRKEPFSIMFHGPSSIGKTQLVQIMYMHYGKCFGLPVESEYMYTRCAMDPFWSGQTSSQWCVVMDDVAFLKANGQMDPSLGETLQVGNMTPFCPPQAELEDKGRTPLKIDLLLGTTNTLNLNLQDYFSCPFAVARRWKYYITASIKPEFSRNKTMVDPSLIPPSKEGEYMNIWNFVISVVVPATDTTDDKMKAKYKVVQRFDDIYDMLQFIAMEAKQHDDSQTKALSAMSTSRGVDVCLTCYRPALKCCCAAPFSGEVLTPNQEEENVPFLEEVIPEGETQYYAQSDEYYREYFRNFRWTSDEPIWPIDQEPIEPEPDCQVSWIRYWILSRIIAHDTIDYDFEYNLQEFYNTYKTFIVPVFLTLFYYDYWNGIYVSFIYVSFYLHKYMWRIAAYYYQFAYGDFWKYRLGFKLLGRESSAYVFIFRLAKRRIQRSLTFGNLELLSRTMVIIASCKFMVDLYNGKGSKYTTMKKKKPVPVHEAQADVSDFLEGTPPVPHVVEKPTFYYHDPYVFTDVDISNQSKNCQPGVLENKVRRNTARFQFQWEGNGGKWNSTTALNIRGHIWMFNAHAIRGMGYGSMNVLLDPVTQNVSRNVLKVAIQQTDVRIEDNDIAFISVRALPPGPSIVEYFAKKDRIPGRFNGEYHLISNVGERSVLPVQDIRKGVCPLFKVAAYLGNVSIPTKNGDCGSACIMHAGANRKIIVGVHATGSKCGGISIMPVSQKLLNRILETFPPQVESGTIVIDAPGFPRELAPLHAKSALRFIPQGTVHVMGSFKGFRPQHKSKVTDTYIKELVVADGYIADHGAPDMTWKPWHLGLTDMTQPDFNVQSQDILICQEALTNDIIVGLGDKIRELKPYDLNTALNGADGVTYVDRINIRTSAGNPFKQSKMNFITLDDGQHITALDDVIADRIKEIEKLYKLGKRAHPQFCEHLKDDPMPQRKIESGATRLFSGAEFAWSLVVRRYLLPHIRLIQNNPFLFESMPGVVAQSEEWQQIHTFLAQFGLDRIVAGDYGKFDKKMIAPFVLSAFDVLISMSTAAKWSKEELMTLRCIAEDTAYSIIEFNGDLIEIQGNPSGHPLTVIINCLVNCLYMRYAFMKITTRKPADFKRFVHLVTYGDDNLMSVSEECPEFNHTAISQTLEKIGVKYTMAEKEAESVPYINIEQASFLKRKFRFDKDIGAIVGPLDHSSIDKMLTVHVDNGQISPEAHSIRVIETALREYFYYGKAIFEERKQYFRELVDRATLNIWVSDSTFPEYEQLVHDFWMKTGKTEQAAKYAPSIQL